MEVAAGWIVAAVAIIGLLLQWRARKRPRLLVCREVARMSLVSIKPKARDRITILFGDRPVANLAQLELDITNESNEVIRDIALAVKFHDDTRILDISYGAEPENLQVSTQSIEANRAQVTIPFMNPNPEHKHRIRASIACDGSVEGVEVLGGGAGWSVRMRNLPTEKQARKRDRVGFTVLIVSFIVGFAYIWSTRWLFDIPSNNPKGRVPRACPWGNENSPVGRQAKLVIKKCHGLARGYLLNGVRGRLVLSSPRWS